MRNILHALSMRRTILFAIIFYALIIFLAFLPTINRARTEKQVHQQLIVAERSNAHNNTTAFSSIYGLPVHLTIKRLKISFPVAKGYYDPSTKKWTLDSQHVFVNAYTNHNPIISTNQANDIVIYGHNFNNVIGKTSQLVDGDILTLDTDNNYRFQYYFVKANTIIPSDVSILNLKSKQYPVILLTCTGTWDQIRRVMYFTPLGAPTKINNQTEET